MTDIPLLLAGSPQFAVNIFTAVLESLPLLRVVSVLTQPPRPVGRKGVLTPSPVHSWALKKGFAVAIPERPQRVPDLDLPETPKLALLVAYGCMIPATLLDIPAWGWWNIHPSPLPHWRGACPMNEALLHGATTTECCLMLLEEGLDSGPVLDRETVQIAPDWRLPELEQGMVGAAQRLIHNAVLSAAQGTLTWSEQIGEPTYCSKISKSDGEISFITPAAVIYNRFRAYSPWPGIFWSRKGENIRILGCRPAPEWSPGPAGTLLSVRGDEVVVGTQTVPLIVSLLQRPGKNATSAVSCLAGLRLHAGDSLL